MSWYGLENLDEAMEKTKEILLPFDLGVWTKIAIIALLATGTGFSFPGFTPNVSFGDGGEGVYTPDAGEDASNSTGMDLNVSTGNMSGMAIDGATGLTVMIALVLAGLAVIFSYLQALFQFVYYQTILDEKPSIRENARKHAQKGLHLFGFRIAFMLFVLGTLVIPIGGFIANPLVGLALLVFVWLPIVLAAVIFSGLVNHFALLRMIEQEEGIIEAWKSVWQDIKAEWREVAVFEIVRFLVGIAIGILQATVMLGLLVLLVVPFGVLAIIAAAINPVLLSAVIVVGLVTGLIVLFVGTLYVRVPVTAYMYTYTTLNYHDITS